jgi:hypothetical protein
VTPPTAGELGFARGAGLDPNAVAAARVVLNAIAELPWPENSRVDLLARLAHEVRADVGTTLGRLALLAAPLAGFDELIDVVGLAEKRVAGLVRALFDVNVAEFSPDSASLRQALERVTQLETENAALRTQLDLVQVRLERAEAGTAISRVMRLEEVANSITSQVAAADDALRNRSSGLRLGGLELRLTGAATAVDQDLALDFSDTGAGTAVGLSFVPGGTSASTPSEQAVPDIRGYAPALARRKLQSAGFAVTLATVPDARGTVAEQSPAPGSLALPGSTVRLLVR